MQRNIDLTDPRYCSTYVHPVEKRRVSVLDLACSSVTDQDIQEVIVPFLNEHPEIENICLNNNNIGDNGAKALASVKSLKAIGIRHNHIGDDGAKAFAISDSIEHLGIANNKIGDVGFKALASNPSIKTLNAYEDATTVISEAAKQAILESDPIKRANYGREVGIEAHASLTRLCLFAVQKSPQLDKSELSDDLRELLAQPRV